MVSTVPLEELEKQASNIYEAIVVIAKRARQINDEQKRFLEQELGFDSTLEGPSSEENDEDSDLLAEDRQPSPAKYIKLPKPTTVSLEEMMAGKLKFDYAETPEEENSHT